MSRDAQLKRARRDLSSRGQLKSGKRRERPFRSVKLHWPSNDPPTFGCKILTHFQFLGKILWNHFIFAESCLVFRRVRVSKPYCIFGPTRYRRFARWIWPWSNIPLIIPLCTLHDECTLNRCIPVIFWLLVAQTRFTMLCSGLNNLDLNIKIGISY